MKATLLMTLSLSLVIHAYAGSATWNLNPTNGDWNTAANWTPATVPNGPHDIATFDASLVTDVSISADTTVDSIVFTASSSPFVVTANPRRMLTVDGAGITNFGTETGRFNTAVDEQGQYARIEVAGNAIVTGPVLFNNEGAIGGGPGGATSFLAFSSADNSMIVNGAQTNGGGGHTFFHNYSTAANATITSSGIGYTAFNNHSSAGHGTFINQGGGDTNFYQSSSAAEGTFINSAGGLTQIVGDHATAANGTFINQGGTATEEGGATIFYNGSMAGNATLIGNPGVNGGEGGLIEFRFHSSGETSRVMIYGNAQLKLTLLFDVSSVTIGSLEGDGKVVLGHDTLNIGSNGLDTTFAGVIDEEAGYSNGSIAKVGTGTLTLTGASAYGGGTMITSGFLLVSNASGSGTGTGAVSVNAGTLGGSGVIAGAVTVGTNTGVQAFLAPSKGDKKPATLTIQGALTLNDDSTCIYRLNTERAVSDEVIANGATIDNGARFSFRPSGNSALTLGQIFTVISNTSATPIVGTFHNLPQGKIIVVNGSNLQASYSGGDGNDLTLTVVP